MKTEKLESLARLLVEAGLLAQPQAAEQLASAAAGDTRARNALVQLAWQNERLLAERYAAEVGTPVAVLSESTVDLVPFAMLAPEAFLQSLVLPVAGDSRSIAMVAADVGAAHQVQEIAAALGRRPDAVLALPGILSAVLPMVAHEAASGRPVWSGPKAPHRRPRLMLVRPAANVAKARGSDSPFPGAGGVPWPPSRQGTPFPSLPPVVMTAPSLAALPPDEALHAAQLAAARDAAREAASPVAQEPPRLELRIEPPSWPPAALPVAQEPPRLELRVEPPSWPQTPPSQDPDASSLVIVVEDDDAIRALITQVLQDDGLTVTAVADGAAAMELLQRVVPGLLVLDAQLPGMHGFDVCRAVKLSPALSRVPVLMVSAIYRGVDHARSIQEEHGADAFLEKPFHPTHLRDLAASLMERPYTPVMLPPEAHAQAGAAILSYQLACEEQDWTSAYSAVEQWLEADPFDGQAHLERGHLYLRANDLEQAMGAYDIAALYLPESADALGALGMACEQLGFVRKARRIWERMWQMQVNDETRAFLQQRLSAAP